VAIPQTPLALGAATYARRNCPDFLFNHSARTFIFGALVLEKQQKRAYLAEDAFVAAIFHDIGLLPSFETPKESFELDGANAVEQWLLKQGGSKAQAERAWYAVELHTGEWALPLRQGPEAMLIFLGASADVDGPDPGDLDEKQIAEVLAAFPRLGFKHRLRTCWSATASASRYHKRGRGWKACVGLTRHIRHLSIGLKKSSLGRRSASSTVAPTCGVNTPTL